MARGGAGQFTVARIFANDEELGKKDDDHRPRENMNSWTSAFMNGPTLRYRSRKRWIYVALGVFFVWAFFHYMPEDILEPTPRPVTPNGFGGRAYPPNTNSWQRGGGKGGGAIGSRKGLPMGPPPMDEKTKVEAQVGEHYYDGNIMYYELPSSLHGISRTMGYRRVNHNVLFAAASLRSAAVLIPLVCEMTRWENNYVHFALLGRNDISLDEVLQINGVDRTECKAYWHDARPDYARYSSDFRAEASVASALEHINTFMHPQVVITDDSIAEEPWFTRQMRIKAQKLGWPVIELPQGMAERMKWVTRLEAMSLAAWHQSSIDILIQAPAESSGSLMRLLKSLASADYSGLTPPRIIIELPPEVDDMTRWYLDNYEWPLTSALQPIHSSQLIVRHRIPGHRISPEEAAVRFLESFYPANGEKSHVLLLTANAQVSPMYFQYLKYYLLRYKYSQVGVNFGTDFVLGMSLDIPAMHLNGSTLFNAPGTDAMDAAFTERTKPVAKDTKPPFLWEAPNANAALYFGDKWIELHTFLQHRLTTFHAQKQPKQKMKLVSETMPAWTEYFLEFMRARGYSLLYPASSRATKSLVTVHTELYHPPEEFIPKKKSDKDGRPDTPAPSEAEEDLEPFVADTKTVLTPPPERSGHATSTSHQPLDAILPFLGDEPDTGTLPHLAFNGYTINPMDATNFAETYAEAFRVSAGGCNAVPKGKRRKINRKPRDASDLFCVDGDEEFEEDTTAAEKGEDGKREPTLKEAEDLLEIFEAGASLSEKGAFDRVAERVEKEKKSKEKAGPELEPEKKVEEEAESENKGREVKS